VPDRPLLLSRREAREFLGADAIGRDTLDRLIASGEIRHLRLGRRVVIPTTELNRWVESQVAEED
jgi:excisionase family DNA binding protein